ncbi:FtsX-like permease family protein [Kitasatospora viridis]|uniref:Putative ABC transport system permease protein n=1 Tax=Kitasatospora viridis TaxID=281105 RepID=A0A561UDQ3_9ACTN|nr:FtsX-like permease family protein [Kitasatospora viridis]TWF97503.1 putative ABC transport system permease protein [Kitasatospora viridis]
MSSDREAAEPRASRPPRTRRSRAVAPWVRTRLRTSRAGALLLAVLVLATAFLAAALPRTLDRNADLALQRTLSDAPPANRSLQAVEGDGSVPGVDSDPSVFNTASADDIATAIEHLLTTPLAPSLKEESYGGTTFKAVALKDPWIPLAGEQHPTMIKLVWVAGQEQHYKMVQGRAPVHTPGSTDWEVALSTSDAAQLDIKLDSVLHTAGATLKVVGLFQVDDPNSALWSGAPCVATACLDFDQQTPPDRFWQVSALIPGAAVPDLPSFASAQMFWQVPVVPNHLHYTEVGAAQQLLNSILNGQQAANLSQQTAVDELQITSELPKLLIQAKQNQQATGPMNAIGPLGAGAIALVVLLLAADLAVDRRRAELLLLRARGGSVGGIAGRLLGETAVLVVPAAAIGTALAILLLPTPRWQAAVQAGAAAALVALVPFPVRAVLLLRGSNPVRRRPAERRPRGRFNPARLVGDQRRLVLELAALALALGAVVAVRRRGVGSTSSFDPLLSSAPLLLALAGAVLLARLFPVLLAPLVRAVRRRPGAIGFLGLARATRTTGDADAARGQGRRAPTVLPLLALLLAVTTAGFGVTVISSTTTARQLAIRQQVGGDARVVGNDQTTLPPGFVAAADKLPGVRAGTAMVVDDNATLGAADGSAASGSFLLIVDPAGYAALAARVGYGQIDPALLDAPTAPGAPVPAILTMNMGSTAASAEQAVQLPTVYGNLHYRVVGTTNGSPILPLGGSRIVMIVSAAAVERQLPGTKPLIDAPNGWFGIGDGISGNAIRKLLTGATAPGGSTAGAAPGATADPAAMPVGSSVDDYFTISTVPDLAAKLGSRPQEHAAEQLFWSAVAASAAFSLLSLLLTLLRAAPERAALLARLRTMGLRPGQGLALILVEALPQALAAAAAGAGLACLAAPLLGPGVNLSAIVGLTVPDGLRIAAAQVWWLAAGLAGLCALVVVAETVVAGRRQINTELRAGDQQ